MAMRKQRRTTSDTAMAAANTAVVLTYAAVSGRLNAIGQLIVSYSGTPTGGNVKVEDGAGNTVFQVDIVAGGPTIIPLDDDPILGSANTALIITLAAGGAGIVGKVNASHWLN